MGLKCPKARGRSLADTKGVGDGIVNENMSPEQIVNAIPPKALMDKVLEEQGRLADDLKRSGLRLLRVLTVLVRPHPVRPRLSDHLRDSASDKSGDGVIVHERRVYHAEKERGPTPSV
jgi:hypothetical protein